MHEDKRLNVIKFLSGKTLGRSWMKSEGTEFLLEFSYAE